MTHDEFCPVVGLPGLWSWHGYTVPCVCEALRKARADERDKQSKQYHVVPPKRAMTADHDPVCEQRFDPYQEGPCPECEMIHAGRADERRKLVEAWWEEGHTVMFNKERDDLTPSQRVGKWIRGKEA